MSLLDSRIWDIMLIMYASVWMQSSRRKKFDWKNWKKDRKISHTQL